MRVKKSIYRYAFVVTLLLLRTLFASDKDFVQILSLDTTIQVDLKYATANNFTGKVLYDSDQCYLRQPVAERLVRVQKALRQSGLGLKIWDGYRPHSVQYKMWELVPNPDFVGDPKKGSRHNRGAAVDVTLVDSLGKELPMPTEYDDFSDKARRDYQDLPAVIIYNRNLLESAMKAEGFLPLASEWWHFDDPDWQKYEIVDIPLTELFQRQESKKQLSPPLNSNTH